MPVSEFQQRVTYSRGEFVNNICLRLWRYFSKLFYFAAKTSLFWNRQHDGYVLLHNLITGKRSLLDILAWPIFIFTYLRGLSPLSPLFHSIKVVWDFSECEGKTGLRNSWQWQLVQTDRFLLQLQSFIIIIVIEKSSR